MTGLPPAACCRPTRFHRRLGKCLTQCRVLLLGPRKTPIQVFQVAFSPGSSDPIKDARFRTDRETV